MKVHLIHGIHTKKEETSTPERLIPDLLAVGYSEEDIVNHEYGWAFGITSRWANDERAAEIARKINPGDVIIAHSNGCLITKIMLADCGILPRRVILLQPALDVDTVFEQGNYDINVFFNKEDKATLIARMFLWFHHPYGAMGRYGYRGSDYRIRNFDTLSMFDVGGHSSPYEESSELRQKVISLVDEVTAQI